MSGVPLESIDDGSRGAPPPLFSGQKRRNDLKSGSANEHCITGIKLDMNGIDFTTLMIS